MRQNIQTEDNLQNKVRSLSTLLRDFQSGLSEDSISVADILDTFHERGFGIILFLLAMPMAVPVPVPPGINIMLALPLVILTWQQMLGCSSLWLPARTRRRHIKAATMHAFLDKAIPWIVRLEKFIKPRLEFMTKGCLSQLIGAAGFIMALSVTIPVPFTNTAPSFGIALMAVGVLMRDGLAVLIGMIFGLTWVTCLTVLAFTLGAEGVYMIKEIFWSR